MNENKKNPAPIAIERFNGSHDGRFAYDIYPVLPFKEFPEKTRKVDFKFGDETNGRKIELEITPTDLSEESPLRDPLIEMVGIDEIRTSEFYNPNSIHNVDITIFSSGLWNGTSIAGINLDMNTGQVSQYDYHRYGDLPSDYRDVDIDNISKKLQMINIDGASRHHQMRGATLFCVENNLKPKETITVLPVQKLPYNYEFIRMGQFGEVKAHTKEEVIDAALTSEPIPAKGSRHLGLYPFNQFNEKAGKVVKTPGQVLTAAPLRYFQPIVKVSLEDLLGLEKGTLTNEVKTAMNEFVNGEWNAISQG